jgi:hypothetical protein
MGRNRPRTGLYHTSVRDFKRTLVQSYLIRYDGNL